MSRDHSHEQGIEEISDTVVRIPLPLPLPELRSVNCYLVRGPDGHTLIDPGWVWPQTTEALEDGLRAVGLALDDVARVLVTHSHWDHYSQAYRWKLERGTTVLLGHGERHSIRAWQELDGAFPRQAELLQRAGDPDRAAELAARPIPETERHTDFGPPTAYLHGGEELPETDHALRVIATPGHTRGHLVFQDVVDDLVFTGDHVLPRITPSIAYERDPDRLALRSYLDSLRLLADRPDTTMLPAHGAVGRSVHERVVELLAHHDERLATVSGLVHDGAETAHDVAAGMTWTRHGRRLAELGEDHAWTAVLEAAAHLDLLVAQGGLRREEEPRRDVYLPVTATS